MECLIYYRYCARFIRSFVRLGFGIWGLMSLVRKRRRKGGGGGVVFFSCGGVCLFGWILRVGDEMEGMRVKGREGKERKGGCTCGLDGMGWSMYG